MSLEPSKLDEDFEDEDIYDEDEEDEDLDDEEVVARAKGRGRPKKTEAVPSPATLPNPVPVPNPPTRSKPKPEVTPAEAPERFEPFHQPEMIGVRDNESGQVVVLKQKAELIDDLGIAISHAALMNQADRIEKIIK